MSPARPFRLPAALAGVVALALACVPPGAPPATQPTAAMPAERPAAFGSPAEQAAWVERTLAGLDLEGKAAQMVMVRAFGLPEHPDAASHRALLEQVAAQRVGGVIIFRSELDTLPVLVDELQGAAAVPLLFAADLERSLGFRVPGGTVSLPDTMALGAIPGQAGVDAARFAGELTAREARAAGIHWAFAPVADVNVDPANPVINLRSFGEDPQEVARRVAAWIEGARAGGVLTAVKHFPGHGDTAVDSHLVLPTIPGDRARLERVELPPFRAAIAAGVDSVMTGHLAVPALDPSGAPATLSKAISTDLLRGELGFQGLIVTDAMEMRGVGATWMGQAAVEAVAAGADMVLLPPDPRVAIQSLVRAVAEGQLTEARLDQSVRRILEVKARFGLHRDRSFDRARLRRDVGRPQDVARAEEIARQAITVVRNERGILPLAAEEPLRVLHLVLSSDRINFNPAVSGSLIGEELSARGVAVRTLRGGPELAPQTVEAMVEAALGHENVPPSTHVVVSLFVRVSSSKGQIALDPSHAGLLERLAAAGARMVVVSYGNPYLLTQIPAVPAYVCAYSVEEASQRAAIAVLFGEHAAVGKLPVTLPGLYPRGHGLELAARDLTLRPASPEAAGFRAEGLAELDRLLESFVARGAFPGGVVAVGRKGQLAHLRAFGRQTYAPDSREITPETLYDLASLTKVVATTTAAMILVDEERLDLDAPVASYLPRFRGQGKEKVKVHHLLLHNSGMDWWGPLYQTKQGKAAFLDHIYGMELVAEPGAQMKYSDLGILLLGEILERVSGRPLDAFVRERVFVPLGMTDTGWLPDKALLPRIAPTEMDPWRDRLVHGEVHDENTFALGGIAPHAGLFGTAGDLARFAQMLLWHGVYDHKRLVKRETIDLFTRAPGQPAGSSRALGWDTKSPTGSSAGMLFSPKSYGHTGYTGTSLWIDPERELFVILLTNRVHPSRENNQIREARPAVADAVIKALIADERAAKPVRAGLDRVAAGEVPALRGKKLGLVAHAASVALDGRHAAQVLRDQGLDLVRLFSPEHGLRGQAAAGEEVPGEKDPSTGLPVFSLYGARSKPTAEDLKGLDALVIDLQDAGVRFFTYASTLMLCLEAAGEAGLPVVVLDRPNPLGGERIEGPVRAALDEVPYSLVSRTPGPLVHGLTLGELARFVNSQLPKPAPLEVVAMEGWRRSMTWRDTGRPWVAPSPNLRSAEAALAYPGVALLEATNINEGRGSEAPFLLFGAPWLDSAAVPAGSPGFRLVPATYTPTASAASRDPKYLGEACHGWRVEVADGAGSPYRLGVSLLKELSARPGFEWRREGAALTWLVGTPVLLERLRAGLGIDAIVAADAADHAFWRGVRQPFLLY